MEVTGPGSVHSSFPIRQFRDAAGPSQTPAQPAAPQDEVEISPVAKKLESLSQMPDVREARLAQIRSAIEAGDYETSEKLEIAVDRLLDNILSDDEA